MASRRTRRGLRPVGAAHVVEYGLTLLIDKAGEQLLRVPEDQSPGKDLCGCVQCAEAGDELASHEQQAEEGGDRARWELEGGERNGQAVPFGRALDAADGSGSCYGSGGEADELDHQEVRRFGGVLDHIVDVSHWHTELWFLTDRNERFRLGGWAHDCYLASLLRSETQGDQSRVEKARDRHPDCQQQHECGRDDDDVSEAAQTYVLAQRCRACRSYDAYDLAALVLDDSFLGGGAGVFVLLGQRMVRILDAKLLGDPLKLLPSRVLRREMTLHVVEQAGHLTKDVAVRCQAKEVSFGGVEVAPCPLDKWSIAEDAEPSVRVQLHHFGCLPGRFKVTVNRRR